ncbi:MAG: DNA polymerase III subunit alpha, partial [Planctomycetes bacterium]|nr:DNA polymerase III subunit alpha [Planctomycetota bacterium]
QYSEGLIVLSGCPKSEFGKAILDKEEGRAKKIIKNWIEIFGKENVFIEIQEHELEIEKMIQHYGEKISKDLGVDLIATNDTHYIDRDHYKAHDVLLALNTGTTIFDENRLKYETPSFYLKSAKEMYKTFPSKFHKALENTLKIAEKCNLRLTFDEIHMPIFNTGGKSAADLLSEMCNTNLPSKYKDTEAAKQRLAYELSVINKMKFASYFLIVQDIVNYAKKQNIQVGPGRGSAAGSIISYLLGITDIDPLEYNLLFERFLNPERRELPDIDIDLEPAGRSKIISYLKGKYGEDNVAQIITYSVMKSRLVIRDVARAMNIELKTADKLAKRIPRSQIIDVTIGSVLKQDAELAESIKNDEKLRELIEISMKLEGLRRHVSKHAAGIVISDKPLMEYCPLYYKENEEITQYDMNAVQKLGLLKIDILGVETLSIINNTLELINKTSGNTLKLSGIPLNDKHTFELLCKGLVKGVFQLEATKAAGDLLFKIKPERIHDIMTAVALNRPGPMQTGMVDQYILGKAGNLPKHKISQLNKILEETYGACIYQEQVMLIANVIGGFTLAEADGLRKAMGKKIPELMEEYREKFIDGAVNNNVSKNDAAELFEEIKQFAGYAFNKSHACAYGLISYYTAYLKANYPLEFMSVLLTHNMSDHDKMYDYLLELHAMNIGVLPPCANKSGYGVSIEGDKLRLGLGCIRTISENVAREIITTRNFKTGGAFKDLIDFCESVNLHGVDKKCIEYLIKSGAFDSIEINRSFLINNYEQIMKLSMKKNERTKTGQLQLFGDVKEMDYPNLDKSCTLSNDVLLAFEKEALGLYLRDNPIDKYREILQIAPIISIAELENNSGTNEISICGLITQMKMKLIHSGPRRGSRYAVLKISDLTGHCEAVCFQTVLEKFINALKEDTVVYIDGKLDFRGEKPSIIANYVEEIDKYMSSRWLVKVPFKALDNDKLDRLKEILRAGAGNLPVIIEVADNDNVFKVSLGNSFMLKPNNENVSLLRNIFGQISITHKNGG